MMYTTKRKRVIPKPACLWYTDFQKGETVMQELKEKIMNEGKILSSEILKVDSFLNHQIDPVLVKKIGAAFASYFQDKRPTKIMTVESSGIAPAVFTGLELGIPVLYARKQKSLTLTSELYTSDVYSYTKETMSSIAVSKDFLGQGDRVLIIDDFLANGQAVKGMLDICSQAGAQPVGAGIVIEKSWQTGRLILEEQGLDVCSLARIEKMTDGVIEWRD